MWTYFCITICCYCWKRSQVSGIFPERKHGRGPRLSEQPLTRSNWENHHTIEYSSGNLPFQKAERVVNGHLALYERLVCGQLALYERLVSGHIALYERLVSGHLALYERFVGGHLAIESWEIVHLALYQCYDDTDDWYYAYLGLH